MEKFEAKEILRSYPPIYDRPHPWIFVSHGLRNQIQTFYNVSEGRYIVKSIPELRDKNICNCDDGTTGWMFLEDKMSDDCCLYNIITEQRVDLPPRIGHENASSIHSNVIITLTPTNPNCRVFFFTCLGQLITCKVGDSSYVTMRPDPEFDGFQQASMIKGKIYGMLCHTVELVVADNLEYPTRLRKVGLSPHPEMLGLDGAYLVDCAGEILLVQKNMLDSYDREQVVVNLKVFLADFTEMVWVKLRKIGNHAIFLDKFRGFTCSTKDIIGIKPNCIYFISGEKRDRSIHVFDMEDESLTITLPCPKVNANCSRLEWIVMPGRSHSPISQLASLYKKLRNII